MQLTNYMLSGIFIYAKGYLLSKAALTYSNNFCCISKKSFTTHFTRYTHFTPADSTIWQCWWPI